MTDLPSPPGAISPPGGEPEEPPRWELVQPPVPVAPPSAGTRHRQVLLAVGAAAVLLVAVVAGVTAAGRSPQSAATLGAGTQLAAADPTPTPTPQAASQCQAFLTDLAQRLGVSTTTLQGAVTGALQDMIDQAARDGRITQEQATTLKSRLAAAQGSACLGLGGLRGLGPGRLAPVAPTEPGMGPMERILNPSALLDAAASALKIDSGTLQSDLRSGKDLQTIAQSQGVAYTTVTAAIQAAAKQQLDAAVQNGTLTSTQETAILDALQTALQNGRLPLGFGGFGARDWGGPGGHPFGSGPWGGRGQGPAPTATPGPLSGA